MTTHSLHIPLFVLNVFLALTSLAGGIGLLAQLNMPPVDLLSGSMFHDYSVPGFALMFFVGGSSSLAAVMALRRKRSASLASIVSGGMIMMFEVVEVLVIGSPAGVARSLQLLYGTYGIVLIVLAAAHKAGRGDDTR